MNKNDRKQQIIDIVKEYAEGNYHLDITEHDLHIAADRIVKLFAIPDVIRRFCEGQKVEWNELKYWVVEDNGEDKVLVANSETQQHPEYNDWWVNRNELNAP